MFKLITKSEVFTLRTFLIFTDIHGRKWICGKALRILFGMVEVSKKFFWDYDSLCGDAS